MFKGYLFRLLLVLFFILFYFKNYSQSSVVYQFGGHLSSNYTFTDHPIDGPIQYGNFNIKCNVGKLIWNNKEDIFNYYHFLSKNLTIHSGLSIFSRYFFYNSNYENIRSGEFKIYPYISFYFPYNFFCYISGGIYYTLWRTWNSNPTNPQFNNPKVFGIGAGYELGCGYKLPVFRGINLEPYFAYNNNILNQKAYENYNFSENLTNLYITISIQIYYQK